MNAHSNVRLKVALSYASDTHAYVRPIVDHLEAKGFQVFPDYDTAFGRKALESDYFDPYFLGSDKSIVFASNLYKTEILSKHGPESRFKAAFDDGSERIVIIGEEELFGADDIIQISNIISFIESRFGEGVTDVIVAAGQDEIAVDNPRFDEPLGARRTGRTVMLAAAIVLLMLGAGIYYMRSAGYSVAFGPSPRTAEDQSMLTLRRLASFGPSGRRIEDESTIALLAQAAFGSGGRLAEAESMSALLRGRPFGPAPRPLEKRLPAIVKEAAGRSISSNPVRKTTGAASNEGNRQKRSTCSGKECDAFIVILNP